MAVFAALLLAPAATCAAAPAHGRAWELVTPGPTNGVKMRGARAWSPDGDRVAFATLGPMAGAPSGDLVSQALATRTAAGWTQQLIGEPFSIPTPDFQTSGPLAISSDMSAWLWSSTQPLLPGAPPAGQVGMYLRGPDGRLALLGAAGDRGDVTFAGASADLRHAAFQSNAHLLPADAGRQSGGDAYEFAGTELRLVGADSAGMPISTCGSEVGNGDASSSVLLHAVSHDGSRIFFSAPTSSDCGQPRAVYLREDGSRTTEISASACTRPDCDGPQDATFAGALPDGSSALLVTGRQLTDDDTDASTDLYRYDVADGALTRLSAGPPGVAADVNGSVVRASDDGTRVYFLASGLLVPGRGQQGGANLYLSDHGHLRFLATADGVDLRTAAISPDGRTLAFATSSALLASDTDSSVDVYRFDAATGTLEQISRGTGDRGNGAFDVTFGTTVILDPIDQEGLRYASADGSRVFFVTSEPLLPEDVDMTSDVYEWADGALGLVTSGDGDETVAYSGVSADGRSAFFTTDETLVSADRNDGDEDLYVARLGGGFPDRAPPPAACDGEACQGAPGGRLAPPAPASLTFLETSARPFRIRALDRRTTERLVRTGHATIVVDVPRAGRISIVAYARIHGRSTVVAHAGARARGPTSLRLSLRLSPTARRILHRERQLRLTLVLRHARLGAARAIVVRLRSAA